MAAGKLRVSAPYLLTILAVLLFVAPPVTNAADYLSFGQHLLRNQTLVSQQNLFELGFFSPGSTKNRYLGIWYKNVRQRTYVWVANRDKPISESDADSALLKISDDGRAFALFANTSSTTPIWSSSSSFQTGKPSSGSGSGSNSTRLLLLDTGNLVLVVGNSTDPSAVLWESFDHPTDTVLPGAKIGYNRTSGHSWPLTSWKNSDDPSPGNYTLQIDPSGASQYLLVWNVTGQPYWSTGLYDGRIFANIPEMTGMKEYGFNHSDPSDTAAKYFSYFDNEVGGVSGMFVDSSGLLKWQKWIFETEGWQVFTRMPKDPCLVPSHCGAFGFCFSSAYPPCQCLPGFDRRSASAWAAEDYTAGCVRKAPLACGTAGAGGESDGFLPVDAVLGLPADPNANATTLLTNIGSSRECEGACLRNCSCTAFSFDGSSGCRIRSGDLMNLKQVQQVEGFSSLQLRVASSELKATAGGAGGSSSSTKNRNNKTVIIIALLSGVLATLLISIPLALCYCTRRKRNYRKSNPAIQGSFMSYTYKELQNATKDFSKVIGKGGFGSVYKGTLPNNTTIAVKKLELGLGVGNGEKQFRSEVSTMATIQHIHILQLRGVCCQGPHRMLIYDYMPNGSLDAHLYPATAVPMPWAQRYRVALGVARGLAYLHDKCRDRIVHCDVKPENILLDGDMVPKVADFGMAKLIGRDFSRALTTMRGTVGYLAPEWISGAPITPKADVYSFGMMLFEIVSGRRNGELPLQQQQSSVEVRDGSRTGGGDREVWFFPMWAATNAAEGAGAQLADDTLPECEWNKGADQGHGVEEFRRACRVACWCVQDSEENRPTIAQVIQMLEGVLDLGVPPIPRHLRNHVQSEDAVCRKLSFYSLIVDS